MKAFKSSYFKSIHFSGVAILLRDDKRTRRLRFDDNGMKLRLEQLEMSDAANYSCHAHNLYGQDSITYHLVVKRKSRLYGTRTAYHFH